MNDVQYRLLNTLIQPPISGGRPSGGVSSDTDGIPSIGGENIVYSGGMSYTELKRIPEAFFRFMPKGKLQINDVLINKDGAQTGKVGLYDGRFEAAAVNEHVFILRSCNTEEFDQHYLYYCVLLPETRMKIERRITGSAQPGLNSQFVRAVDVPFRNIRGQLKVACVLKTIDQTIEKTEALIEKYQQIKAGLMHDLFTRGIGVDGKLRPPREQAPELYQETPIGWIPKEWGYDFLEKLLAPVANNLRSGPFGSALLKSELAEDGIPFLGIDNIYVERFEESFRRFVSKKKYRELGKYAVRPKDVVITIMGTVGRAAVIPNHIDLALSSKHLWTMTFNQELVIPELVCWQLNYAPWVKVWFRRETQGGIMDAIQSKTLRTLILPLPPPGEQKMIFDRYNSITSKIEAEQRHLKKSFKEKSGLMHDLLTGEKPVTVDQPEAVNV